jgi:prepilin-type N-terminal cleavage/methylation domain-containing protein
MNRKNGFTLVELLITMVIMVVLITLSVVNLRSTQMTARDDQRTSDVQAIAQQLENYYKLGSDNEPAGQYPPTDDMGTETDVKASLRDIDSDVVRAPNVAPTDPISLIIATDTDPLTPTPTVGTYVYQPLQSDGSICGSAGDECRKFNLYYMLESEPNVVKKIISKNQ